MKWNEVQSCLTLWDPMDCSLPGFSVRGIFQARVLEWVAISFSRGSSQARDPTQVFCVAGRRFTLWATRKPLKSMSNYLELYLVQNIPCICSFKPFRIKHFIVLLEYTYVKKIAFTKFPWLWTKPNKCEVRNVRNC